MALDDIDDRLNMQRCSIDTLLARIVALEGANACQPANTTCQDEQVEDVSLVEEVDWAHAVAFKRAVTADQPPGIPAARAAILKVADWLEPRNQYRTVEEVVSRLRAEAEK